MPLSSARIVPNLASVFVVTSGAFVVVVVVDSVVVVVVFFFFLPPPHAPVANASASTTHRKIISFRITLFLPGPAVVRPRRCLELVVLHLDHEGKKMADIEAGENERAEVLG